MRNESKRCLDWSAETQNYENYSSCFRQHFLLFLATHLHSSVEKPAISTGILLKFLGTVDRTTQTTFFASCNEKVTHKSRESSQSSHNASNCAQASRYCLRKPAKRLGKMIGMKVCSRRYDQVCRAWATITAANWRFRDLILRSLNKTLLEVKTANTCEKRNAYLSQLRFWH